MTYSRSKFLVRLLWLAASTAPACQNANSTPPAAPSSGHTASASPAAPPSSTAQPSAPDPALEKDAAVNAAVEGELRRDKQLDQAGIHLATTNGIVQLTGQIDNPLSKERAARMVQAVRGVRAVSNLLQVVPPKRSDSAIQSDVQKALLYNAATAKLSVHVKVQNGTAILTGSVASPRERQLCEFVADGVRGVRFTQNDLGVKRSVPRTSANIVGDVQTRLGWDALIEHDPIAVTAKDGRITLTGRARSAAEKARAVDDAWVDGVEAVDASALAVSSEGSEEHLRSGAPRSDREIASALDNEMLTDPRIASTHVVPIVKGGVVTLTGTVETLRARRAAETAAHNTVGVFSVNNQLIARRDQSASDQTLQGRLEDALIFDPLTDARSIHLTVSGGRVTLTGSVETFFESAEAFDVASRFANITSVDDQLAVRDQATPYVHSPWLDPFAPDVDSQYVIGIRPQASDTDIKHRIQADLKRSLFVGPEDLQVRVEDGKATLTGTVHTYRERQAAADSAVGAGASAVDNELKVD
ncbi:MAG: BON domain-containing protein [Polyangiaceae bacterium]